MIKIRGMGKITERRLKPTDSPESSVVLIRRYLYSRHGIPIVLRTVCTFSKDGRMQGVAQNNGALLDYGADSAPNAGI